MSSHAVQKNEKCEKAEKRARSELRESREVGWPLPVHSTLIQLHQMNSLTRQVGRLALSASRTASIPGRTSLLASSSSRLALASTSTLSARCYATETSHLGNLAPAPGSAHKVSSLSAAPKERAKLTILLLISAETYWSWYWIWSRRNVRKGSQGTGSSLGKWQASAALRWRSDAHHSRLPQAWLQEPVSAVLHPSLTSCDPAAALLPFAIDRELTSAVLAPRSLNQQMTPLNLDRLQHWIDRGLIDPSKPITMKELFETRCVHGIKDGVKLLGDVSFGLTLALSTSADLLLSIYRALRTSLHQTSTLPSPKPPNQQSKPSSGSTAPSSSATRTVSPSAHSSTPTLSIAETSIFPARLIPSRGGICFTIRMRRSIVGTLGCRRSRRRMRRLGRRRLRSLRRSRRGAHRCEKGRGRAVLARGRKRVEV